MEVEEILTRLEAAIEKSVQTSLANQVAKKENLEQSKGITTALADLSTGQSNQAATCLICRTATDRGFEALAVAMKEIMDTRANYARWEKIILTTLAAIITALSYWVGNTKGVNELKAVLPDIVQETQGVKP